VTRTDGTGRGSDRNPDDERMRVSVAGAAGASGEIFP
jgi:hypothetical protein